MFRTETSIALVNQTVAHTSNVHFPGKSGPVVPREGIFENCRVLGKLGYNRLWKTYFKADKL